MSSYLILYKILTSLLNDKRHVTYIRQAHFQFLTKNSMLWRASVSYTGIDRVRRESLFPREKKKEKKPALFCGFLILLREKLAHAGECLFKFGTCKE